MRLHDSDAQDPGCAVGSGSRLADVLFLTPVPSGSPQVADPPVRLPAGHPDTMFVTSHECAACHNGLTTPTGEDVSIGVSWRASMMAQFVARSVLAGGCAARNHRSSAGGRRDRGRMRDLPHADVAHESARRQPARRDLRALADRARARTKTTGLPPTACRARCATRLDPNDLARAKASTADSCWHSQRLTASGGCSGRSKWIAGARRSCDRRPA